jgi:hypothetical protein
VVGHVETDRGVVPAHGRRRLAQPQQVPGADEARGIGMHRDQPRLGQVHRLEAKAGLGGASRLDRFAVGLIGEQPDLVVQGGGPRPRPTTALLGAGVGHAGEGDHRHLGPCADAAHAPGAVRLAPLRAIEGVHPRSPHNR